MTADVAVVGAGIIGLAIARKLARSGAKVVTLDPHEPGSRASWAAAGMLAPQSEADGPGDFFELLLRSRDLYPALVRELEEETGLDVGYRTDGMLVVALHERGEEVIEARRSWQAAAGLPVERLTPAEALRAEPSLSPFIRAAIRFPGDHQVDNRILTHAYRLSAEIAGATLRLGAGVRSVAVSGGAFALEMETGETLEAARVVIAAGSWSGLLGGLPSALPVEPVHGQLLAVETPVPPLRHAVEAEAGYLVPRSDGRLIIGTTVERVGFREGGTEDGLEHLLATSRAIVPSLADRRLLAHWAGLRPGTPDGLPILGEDPEVSGLFYATGHFRNGILLAPVTAEIIGALVGGGSTDIDLRPYRRDRFVGRSAPPA